MLLSTPRTLLRNTFARQSGATLPELVSAIERRCESQNSKFIRRHFSHGSRLSAASNKSPQPPPPKAYLPSPVYRAKKLSPTLVDLSYLDTLGPPDAPVYIYASPDHGAFYFVSYLSGFLILVGAYAWADFALREREGQPNPAWWLKSLLAAETLVVVSFGTLFVLAPTRLVKSISVVPKSNSIMAQAGENIIRFEIRRVLPSWKPRVFETTRSSVHLNRDLNADDFKFTSIPISNVQSFTERYVSQTLTKESPKKRGILASLSSLNSGLLNAWPTLYREVRRMFLRDQLAIVGIDGRGRFKLDLQECYLVDGGKVLNHIASEDLESHGIIDRVKLLFRS